MRVFNRTKKRKKKLMIRIVSSQVPLYKELAKDKRRTFRANSTIKLLDAASHTSNKTLNHNNMTSSQCWIITKKFPSTIWTEQILTWDRPGTKNKTEESKMQRQREKWLTTKLRGNAIKRLQIKFRESEIWAQLRINRNRKEEKTLLGTKRSYVNI